MLAIARSFTLVGLDAVPVEVEAHVAPVLPPDRGAFAIVGLPDKAVQEAKERVLSAIASAELLPPEGRRVVNLAPGSLRKDGPGFDLAIALALLGASGQLPREPLQRVACIGELALDGRLRPARGTLVVAEAARERGLDGVICPRASASEAALVAGCRVFACDHLREVVDLLAEGLIAPPLAPEAPAGAPSEELADLGDVRGQPLARRALEIAAAGAHNMLLIGPPGVGKTMLARRLPGILPPLDPREALETTRILSVAGLLDARAGLVRQRPFRAPHHGASQAALVGGGSVPRPGEVTLATNGVLFLDELPEFSRAALEALRGPLEDGEVLVSRVAGAVRFPARAALVAAMNPCPCGAPEAAGCSCPPGRAEAYRQRVSGPLLDRIDIAVRVARPAAAALRDDQPEDSAAVRERVLAARARQAPRGGPNARLAGFALREAARLDDAGEALVRRAVDRIGLSPRGVDRALRVARTVADLEGAERIAAAHLAEALALRVGSAR